MLKDLLNPMFTSRSLAKVYFHLNINTFCVPNSLRQNKPVPLFSPALTLMPTPLISPCLRSLSLHTPSPTGAYQISISLPTSLHPLQIIPLNQALNPLLQTLHIWRKPTLQLINHLHYQLLMS